MKIQHYEARRLETRDLADRGPGARDPATRRAPGTRQGGAPPASALHHAELAMQAAKKMRRTSQKRKTGHLVCQHLQMMLENNTNLDPGRHKHQYRLGL